VKYAILAAAVLATAAHAETCSTTSSMTVMPEKPRPSAEMTRLFNACKGRYGKDECKYVKPITPAPLIVEVRTDYECPPEKPIGVAQKMVGLAVDPIHGPPPAEWHVDDNPLTFVEPAHADVPVYAVPQYVAPLPREHAIATEPPRLVPPAFPIAPHPVEPVQPTQPIAPVAPVAVVPSTPVAPPAPPVSKPVPPQPTCTAPLWQQALAPHSEHHRKEHKQ
jgi:hypothetical protein